jgi:exosome complex protein LRP1
LPAYLRVNGVNAREHPVFTELTRVRQYFAKLKAAEESGKIEQKALINVEAANRFINSALVSLNVRLLKIVY